MSHSNALNRQPLHVLLLEDVPEDAVLIERQVKKVLQAYQLRVVDNRIDFVEALENFEPDLILADYLLPQFTGDMALQMVQTQLPDVPFVFITGTLDDEEMAAQTILNGASGFVLKNNIARLPNVILEVMSNYTVPNKMAVRLHQLQQKMLQQQYEIAQYQREIAAMSKEMENIRAHLENRPKDSE